jgi:glycerophosphoryl diester phosphodiesterase
VVERPFSQGGGGLVVAHRGDPSRAPENTLAAFEAALAVGADAVEFDVRVTADGAPVVIHDPFVDRTTGGKGAVRATTLSELKRLRVVGVEGGEHEIPTLEETLTLLSGRAMVDVEIKNIPGQPDFDPNHEDAVEATHRALQETAFVGEVLISSFNPASIARSRAIDAGVPTGLLAIEQAEARAALDAARAAGHAWVLPALASLLAAGESVVADARSAGVRLGTWVVDDPELAVRLFRWGVDAIATNVPGEVVRARRRAFP